MFENTPSGQTPEPFQQPGVPPAPPPMDTPALPAESAGQDLHTMPERFFASEGSSGGGGKGMKVVLIILAAVVVVGAGGYFAYTQLIAKKADTENTNVNANAVVNVNRANTNVNANLNTNANANLAVNANQNTNGTFVFNTNSATNLNANLNTNAAVNLNTNTAPVGPLPATRDSDSDGLTDVEETVMGTNANLPDTDADGFIDGKQVNAAGLIVGEVWLGYDPTQAIGKLLDNTKLMTSYTNPTYNYKAFFPAKWSARSSDSANQSVLVSPDSSSATGEYFQAMVEDNPTKLTAKKWYQSLSPTVTDAQIESLTVNGLDGARSVDGNTVYLVKADKTYVLSYNVGTLTAVNFRLLFDVFVRNFTLVAAGSAANTNASATNTATVNSSSY